MTMWWRSRRQRLEDLDAESTARLRTGLQEVVNDSNQVPGVRSAALAALGYFSDVLIADLLGSAFVDPTLRLGAVRGVHDSCPPPLMRGSVGEGGSDVL